MAASLIRREIFPGRAYAAASIDHPGLPKVAVAWLAHDGWRVGTHTGQTVAVQLTKTVALNLMHRTADRLLDQAATHALLTAPVLANQGEGR